MSFATKKGKWLVGAMENLDFRVDFRGIYDF